jgi:hypothetical protein
MGVRLRAAETPRAAARWAPGDDRAERDGLREDPDQEAKAWAENLADVDRKRARFQDMAAEGLIHFDELRAKLVALEEIPRYRP